MFPITGVPYKHIVNLSFLVKGNENRPSSADKTT